ncbi:MAG: TIGR04076 family protein [Candidatus Heimdallarchaeota archaeon]
MSFSLKITVVKVFEPKDIIGNDFIRESGKLIPKCGFFNEGDQFIIPETGAMPEKFICIHAFNAINKHVEVLRLGGSIEDWTGEDTIFGVCPDGIRPVIFKIERIKKEK